MICSDFPISKCMVCCSFTLLYTPPNVIKKNVIKKSRPWNHHASLKKETNLFGYESLKDMIQKFVFLGDDRNIIQIYVGGKLVKDLYNNNTILRGAK